MATKWEMATDGMASEILSEEVKKTVSDALMGAVRKFNNTHGLKGIVAGYKVTVQVTDGLTKYEADYGTSFTREYKKLVREISKVRSKELARQE